MLIAKGRSKDIATKVVTEAINIGNNGIFKNIIYKKLVKTSKQKNSLEIDKSRRSNSLPQNKIPY